MKNAESAARMRADEVLRKRIEKEREAARAAIEKVVIVLYYIFGNSNVICSSN